MFGGMVVNGNRLTGLGQITVGTVERLDEGLVVDLALVVLDAIGPSHAFLNLVDGGGESDAREGGLQLSRIDET